VDIKLVLKSSVAAAALVAVAAPVVSGSAQAGVANGNDNSVVMSGNLTRSIMYMDNGSSNEITHVDGGNDTSSRFRIIVSGKLTESVDVGGIWEANLPVSNNQGSQTTGANATITEAGDSGSFGFRKTEVTFNHATMGKLSIGQSSTASDNRPSLGFASNTNGGLTNGGGAILYNSTAKAQTGTITAGGQFSNYFGTRDDRIRYDSPSFGGFKVAVAAATDNFWDAGLTYGATYGDITVAAAAQYTALNAGGTSPKANMGAGIALTHTSGLGASFYYGQEDAAGGNQVEGSQYGLELGYKTDALSNLGTTGFALVYIRADETTANNAEATLWGIHAKQSMPAGISVFASYENSSYDNIAAGRNYDDLSVALIGTQINF
jgi:hypothetical protein